LGNDLLGNCGDYFESTQSKHLTLFKNMTSTTRGTVLLIHGFAEHAGRFERTANRLRALNWEAIPITLSGHGQEGLRPDIKKFDDYQTPLLQIIKQIYEHARDINEKHPIILLGQSMGALVATRIALSGHADISGLILSSPAFGVADPIPKLALKLLHFLGRLVTTMPLIPPPKGGAKTLSHIKIEQTDFENDRLCWHGWLGPRMASQLAYASNDTEERIHELTIPILMLWGEADTVIAPNAMLRASKKINPQYLSKRIWPDARHHLFTDRDTESHFQQIAHWLDQHWA
jgi:acylglycerol lipase